MLHSPRPTCLVGIDSPLRYKTIPLPRLLASQHGWICHGCAPRDTAVSPNRLGELLPSLRFSASPRLLKLWLVPASFLPPPHLLPVTIVTVVVDDFELKRQSILASISHCLVLDIDRPLAAWWLKLVVVVRPILPP